MPPGHERAEPLQFVTCGWCGQVFFLCPGAMTATDTELAAGTAYHVDLDSMPLMVTELNGDGRPHRGRDRHRSPRGM